MPKTAGKKGSGKKASKKKILSNFNCISKAFFPKRRKRSYSTDTHMMSVANSASRASRIKFMDSFTLYLKLSLKEAEKVAFIIDKSDDAENDCLEIVMTNKELLKMLQTGKNFQPTVISKDNKEALHGLWMKVSSETNFEEIEKFEEMTRKQETVKPKIPSTALFLAKQVSIVTSSIVASAIVAFFIKDGAFLNSLDPIHYLKLVLLTTFISLIALSFAIGEIITLRSETVVQNGNDFSVELKVDVEKWSKDATSTSKTKSTEKASIAQSNGDGHANTNKSEPEVDYPVRYLRAAKGDPIHGRERYESTMAWRKEERMDTILDEPFIYYKVIKENYPHYYHLRGKNNEVVFFESPAKIKLENLKKAGMVIEDLLRYYAMITEYMWTRIDSSEEAKSVYVMDLEGMGIFDFVGEVVDFVKRAAAFTNAHFPERCGTVFIVNVPSWFNIVWKVVSPLADEVTRRKIRIVRGKVNILNELKTRIDIENIPSNYGGKSTPLGESPEEEMFMNDMEENLRKANLSPVVLSK